VSGTPSIRTRFTEAYGLRHPFAAAGLAFAGMTPEFVIAVCKAGGLGAYGVGLTPPPVLGEAVAAVRAQTDAPFNLNFITIFATDDHIAFCEEARPAVASFHWGHPSRAWIDRLHGAGVKVWEQVGSADAAKRAVDDGVDLIVAQGSEAGGHNYAALPTFANTPEIVDACDGALVLASGGVSDGRGVAAALALGADGVWVGSRLVATDEANVPTAYKERIVSAGGADTALTSIFGREIEGFNPMRVLRNAIVEEWRDREDEAPVDLSDQPAVGEMTLMGQSAPLKRFSNLVPMADATGDFDQMPLLMGEGVGSIGDIVPVEQAVETMMADAAAILSRLGAAAAQ